jgi:hypothetical protein
MQFGPEQVRLGKFMRKDGASERRADGIMKCIEVHTAAILRELKPGNLDGRLCLPPA